MIPHEVAHTLAVHRRGRRAAVAAFDLVILGLALLVYGVVRLICWGAVTFAFRRVVRFAWTALTFVRMLCA